MCIGTDCQTKSAFLFIDVDVIRNSLQNIANHNHFDTSINTLFWFYSNPGFKLQLNNCQRWFSGFNRQLGKEEVAGSIPVEDKYFHFKFLLAYRSLQLSGAHANEIKHDHSPVEYVVLEPNTINLTKPLHINHHRILLTSLFQNILCAFHRQLMYIWARFMICTFVYIRHSIIVILWEIMLFCLYIIIEYIFKMNVYTE